MNKNKKFKKNSVSEKWEMRNDKVEGRKEKGEMRNEKWEMRIELWINKKKIFYWFFKLMNYYWFNRQGIEKAKENYSKEKAAEY